MADVSKLLLLLLLPLLMASSADSQALHGCLSNYCGEVEIPYPFGFREECARDKRFLISCNDTVDHPKPFFRGMEVLKISLSSGEATVNNDMYRGCYNDTAKVRYDDVHPIDLLGSPFALSTKNKFTATGCATTAFMITSDTANSSDYASACSSICPRSRLRHNNSCTGVGCCETSIREGLKYFEVDFDTYYPALNNSDTSPCSYAFLVEDGSFVFNRSFITKNFTMKLPVVLDWAVENCSANYSYGISSAGGLGYLCKCRPGFEGNPYHNCEDIDECKQKDTKCHGTCINTIGGFRCECPKGMIGDASTIDGCNTANTRFPMLQVFLGIGFGILFLLVGSFWLCWVMKKRKLLAMREKFFKQNGGLLLKNQLSTNADVAQLIRIFLSEELKKATDSYNEDRILGEGGQGTVYKGILPDGRVVAIKKSKLLDQSQVEQFINEMIVLSQTIHRNIVRLMGCCLESEIPLLVYEFIPNGTLSNHIYCNVDNHHSTLSWESRLKIAADTAGAIGYLHTAVAIPIIHRDIKSDNILLNTDFTAKVSDFGISKLVALEEGQVTTLVKGTLGYLDPSYFQTGQLTEKSDVYSFGVVLLELLTGEKPVSLTRPEEQQNLAQYFLLAMHENRLLEILDPRISSEAELEQIKAVAKVAKGCLMLKADERPSMKEVEVELEKLTMAGDQRRHPWIVYEEVNEEAAQIELV